MLKSPESFNLGDLLKLSKGEEESKGRENTSLLADSFEAFIGALFLDQGAEAVSDFLTAVLLPKSRVFSVKKALKDSKVCFRNQYKPEIKPHPFIKSLKRKDRLTRSYLL